ncbi:hypothetical protein LY76DRAFT_142552 [Colletotrichum caudatum]|nr:hypothetical protein LY76DRAFT_142552 [Colletotrichum caudatum]
MDAFLDARLHDAIKNLNVIAITVTASLITMNEVNIKSGRRVSFGRGGAGNIRNYSDARITENSPPPKERRRSSVWSTSSAESILRSTSLPHGVGYFYEKIIKRHPREVPEKKKIAMKV